MKEVSKKIKKCIIKNISNIKTVRKRTLIPKEKIEKITSRRGIADVLG